MDKVQWNRKKIMTLEGNVKYRLAVSLISLNQVHHLRRLLPTIIENTRDIDCQILLVANRCEDETIEFVRGNFPEIDILINEKVTGYGGNHNLNLERCNSEYFAIMNSDMLVRPGTFSRMIGFLEANAGVGLIAPKVLNEDGTIQYLNKRYPAVFDLFLRKFCPARLQRFFKKRMDSYEMKDIDYNSISEVPLLSGSFMLGRTEQLRRLKGFDEHFFLYFEDYDLCRRFQKEGMKMVFFPEAEVVHFWERSAHKSWKFAAMFINSAIKYFNRWGWKVF